VTTEERAIDVSKKILGSVDSSPYTCRRIIAEAIRAAEEAATVKERGRCQHEFERRRKLIDGRSVPFTDPEDDQ